MITVIVTGTGLELGSGTDNTGTVSGELADGLTLGMDSVGANTGA